MSRKPLGLDQVKPAPHRTNPINTSISKAEAIASGPPHLRRFQKDEPHHRAMLSAKEQMDTIIHNFKKDVKPLKFYCNQVAEFTKACGNLINKPVFMDTKGIEFIKDMVNDELLELKEAKTIAEQADALVDAIYYLFDTAVKHGIDLDPIFSIVHNANLKKIRPDGHVIKSSNGKIEKPEDWVDPWPQVIAEIENQEKNGTFK